tara:strand:- start:817 stop:1044 length:228 start_codon:yes stop_codon:yes gene_type:complete
MGPSELKWLKQLEEDNHRLKKLVTDLTVDKAKLQDGVAENSEAASKTPTGGRPSKTIWGQRTAGVFSFTVFLGFF